jgi:hypothetical protein
MIERWLRVPHHKEEIERTNGRVDPQNIRKETILCINRLEQLSNIVFGQFIKNFGTKQRRHRLPSR